MKDTWILPLPLCESTCKLFHAFMCTDLLLQVVFPNLIQLVQFPYVIHVNCLIYTICTSLLYYCFAFCFKFVVYTLSQNNFFIYFMLIHAYISKRQIIMQEICSNINMFHDVVMYIYTF